MFSDKSGTCAPRALRSSFRHSLLDLLIGVVLTQRIHRPNRSWNPAYDSQLQNQANNASYGPTYREKG
jgi:hypothetical protein